MNIEQLSYLLERAYNLLEENDVENALSQAAELLSQLASNPGNTDVSSQLQTFMDDFRATAHNNRSNIFSPREIELLMEMGLRLAIPKQVFQHVQSLVSSSEVYAAANVEKIKALQANVSSIKKTYTALKSVISDLHLETILGEFQPEFDLGAELSFYVPRKNAEHSLNDLRKELRDFELLVSSAGELVGRGDYRVHYLSASDFGFILGCYPEIVTIIVVALDQFTARVGQIKTAKEMFEWGFLKPGDKKVLEKAIDDLSGDQFLSLAGQITADLVKNNANATPEQVSKFSKAITITAAKVQEGYRFDARITMETAPQEEDGAVNGDQHELETAQSMIDIVARLAKIEATLSDQKYLPPPEEFMERVLPDDE